MSEPRVRIPIRSFGQASWFGIPAAIAIITGSLLPRLAYTGDLSWGIGLGLGAACAAACYAAYRGWNRPSDGEVLVFDDAIEAQGARCPLTEEGITYARVWQEVADVPGKALVLRCRRGQERLRIPLSLFDHARDLERLEAALRDAGVTPAAEEG